MHLRILASILVLTIFISGVYGYYDDEVGEGLFVDGEGYIGPYLAGMGDDISEDISDDEETGEGILVDDEGYIGHYLGNVSDEKNSTANLSNSSRKIRDPFSSIGDGSSGTSKISVISFSHSANWEKLIEEAVSNKGIFEMYGNIPDYSQGPGFDGFFGKSSLVAGFFPDFS